MKYPLAPLAAAFVLVLGLLAPAVRAAEPVVSDVLGGVDGLFVWDGHSDWPDQSTAHMAFLASAESPTDLWVCPAGGDPTAGRWQVVNERWVRNFYADGAITMSDRDTGLMWVYDAGANGFATWNDALSRCNNLVYAGYSDWFLPDKDLLSEICSQQAFFTGVVSGEYWSSTPDDYCPQFEEDIYRIFVDMGNCFDDNDSYDYDVFAVWPCRFGNSQAVSSHRLYVAGGTGSGFYPAGTVVEIGADINDGQSFVRWKVASTDSEGCLDNPNLANTTITMPAHAVSLWPEYARIEILTPRPGQTWWFYTRQEIVWAGTHVEGEVSIEISGQTPWSSGLVWHLLGIVPVNEGVFSWLIPNLVHTVDETTTIRVRSVANPDLYGMVTVRTLEPCPLITVTSPRANDVYYRGDTIRITWDIVREPGQDIDWPVHISLGGYSGGGPGSYIIAPEAPNTGVYEWLVPADFQLNDFWVTVRPSPLLNLSDNFPCAGNSSEPWFYVTVQVPDPNLAAAMRQSLHLENNAVLTHEHFGSLVNLGAAGFGISDLAGIEHCHSLRTVNLAGNHIVNLQPLLDNQGFGAGDTLVIAGNPLTNDAHVHQIPALQSRGVTVISDQFVNFSLPSTKSYGDSPFMVSPTATSGLPVTLESDNEAVATVVATRGEWIVAIRGAGTATITATQPGDEIWPAASPVEKTLAVTPAMLMVTADNKMRRAGEANPPLTITYAGLRNADTAPAIPPTASCAAAAASPPGVYPITLAGGSDPNYMLTLWDGVLLVHGQGDAAFRLSASDGMAEYTDLLFGEAPDATSDLDDNWDTVAAPGQVARLFCPFPSVPEQRYLARDFRPIPTDPAGVTRWRLEVGALGTRDERLATRETVTLTWNVAAAAADREVWLQALVDERPVGFPVDMKVVGELAGVAPGTVFEIVYGALRTHPVELRRGWNAVGTPLLGMQTFGELAGRRADGVIAFPAWRWGGDGFVRVGADAPFLPETGYLLLCVAETATLEVVGLPPDGVFPLAAGWNLLSTVDRMAPPTVRSGGSAAWRWDGASQSHRPADAFEPGRAYWWHGEGEGTGGEVP